MRAFRHFGRTVLLLGLMALAVTPVPPSFASSTAAVNCTGTFHTEYNPGLTLLQSRTVTAHGTSTYLSCGATGEGQATLKDATCLSPANIVDSHEVVHWENGQPSHITYDTVVSSRVAEGILSVFSGTVESGPHQGGSATRTFLAVSDEALEAECLNWQGLQELSGAVTLTLT